MDVDQTNVDDPNAAVLLNEEGLCTYGKLPEAAIGELAPEQIREINSRLAKVTGTMDDLRETASEALGEFGFGPVQWPLPESDIEKIRGGEVPEGLFLTHPSYSVRSSEITNETSND